MFAYCENNPCNFSDETGERLVGVGVQFQLNVGYYTAGFELVLFFDPKVCGNSSYLLALYSYEGYSIDIFDFIDQNTYNQVFEKLLLAAGTINADETISETALMAVQQALFGDLSLSVSLVLIFGNESFETASSYSGNFTNYSISGNHWQATYSSSPTCFSISGGFTTNTGWGFSLGNTVYGAPVILLEGTPGTAAEGPR